MNEIKFFLTTPFITLGQLVKAAGIAENGGMSKAMIQDGCFLVNGQVETRRGRKLVVGDRVQSEYSDEILLCGEDVGDYS